MELMLISRTTLKIVLTDDEMKKYGLYDTDDISGKTQLSRLLDDIKSRSGFDTANSTVSIELFESIGGGCEMFISKESRKDTPSSLVREAKTESIITYKFDAADVLISVSRRINAMQNPPRTRLICDECDNFYLMLTLKDARADKERLIFLDEYGERIFDSSIRLYLDEHGRVICPDNAIEILSEL